MDQDYEIIKEMIINALDNLGEYNQKYLFENGEVDFHFATESGKSYVGLRVESSRGYIALRVRGEKAIEISTIIELEFPTRFEGLLKIQGKTWLIEKIRR